MGKVYDPEIVSAGRVPEPGAHQEAGQFLLKELFIPTGMDFSLAEQSGVIGAMVYGSTTTGAAGIRADVDFLSIYDPRRSATALPIIQRTIAHAERRFNVVVEPNILYEGALANKYENGLDPQFAHHLIDIQNQSEPRWSFGWPVRDLERRLYGENPWVAPEARQAQVDPEQIRTLALRYCSAKVRSYAKSMPVHDASPINYDVYQRAFELPGAIGRKILPVLLDDLEKVNKLVVNEKTVASFLVQVFTDQIERTFGSILPVEGAADKHMKLMKLDSQYTEFLEQTVAGKFNILQYRGWLASHYRETVMLAHDVSQFWLDVIKHSRDTKDAFDQYRQTNKSVGSGSNQSVSFQDGDRVISINVSTRGNSVTAIDDLTYDGIPLGSEPEDDDPWQDQVLQNHYNDYFRDGVPIGPEPHNEDLEDYGESDVDRFIDRAIDEPLHLRPRDNQGAEGEWLAEPSDDDWVY